MWCVRPPQAPTEGSQEPLFGAQFRPPTAGEPYSARPSDAIPESFRTHRASTACLTTASRWGGSRPWAPPPPASRRPCTSSATSTPPSSSTAGSACPPSASGLGTATCRPPFLRYAEQTDAVAAAQLRAWRRDHKQQRHNDTEPTAETAHLTAHCPWGQLRDRDARWGRSDPRSRFIPSTIRRRPCGNAALLHPDRRRETLDRNRNRGRVVGATFDLRRRCCLYLTYYHPGQPGPAVTAFRPWRSTVLLVGEDARRTADHGGGGP